MHGFFVTGTDTGVGKTVVTAALARLLCRQDRPVRVCKPVATGASWTGERWLSDDTVRLAEAVGRVGRWDEVTAWTFAEPTAPPVAARQQGMSLRLAQIVEAVRQRSHPGAMLLIEGVGGLLCPLSEDATVADLAAELGLPLLVVARRSLGTLNHTLLTLEAAFRRGLVVAGVVVNETTPPEGLAEATNVAELRRLGVPVLAVVPHQTQPWADVPTALAAVDWWA